MSLRTTPHRRARAGAASLLVLLLLGCTERTAAPAAAPVVGEGLPAGEPPPEPAAVEEEARVVEASGGVERLRDGGWVGVHTGERLRSHEALRTGPGGYAELAIGEHSRMTVAEETQLRVGELTRAVHRFRVGRGRVSVDYRSDGARVLRIENEDGRAVAETSGARFSVLGTGASFAVATETGLVNLEAAGRKVALGAGEESVALADGAPEAPRPIATAVLLKVARAADPDRAACAVVEGRAAPGAEVTVDGEPAQLGGDGAFRVRVARAPGKDGALVRVRDASGRTREERVRCAALPAAPKPERVDQLQIKWGD
ncbi:MAG: FecR domain-containing protein [Myxococcales bacterium]